MHCTIRLATKEDAAGWVDLLQAQFGSDYPSSQVYDRAWVAGQLDAVEGSETWVAEENGKLTASVTFLPSEVSLENPVANLGRSLFLPSTFANGSAQALVERVTALAIERGQMVVARVLSGSLDEMALLERQDYHCAGFQPLKHVVRSRHGVFFYVHASVKPLGSRIPLSESMTQVSSLAARILPRLHISNPLVIRDGVTGYPLKNELEIHQATQDDFLLWKQQATGFPSELSSGFNRGVGYLRIPGSGPMRALLAQKENQMVAGVGYQFDEVDRCIKILESFSLDDTSLGTLLQHVVKVSQEEFSASYLETDILMTAPRLLKTAEQLGFIPVAYLPAFFHQVHFNIDVVKMVKLNMVYSREETPLSEEAAEIAGIIDNNFQDQKLGIAIINLLRALPIFEGLGDGELQKIARLFTQKLYRPGEAIFKQGDSSNEAYVLMRGQIDICLESSAEPIATITNGQIFGEVAFLDGSSRTANAVARVPSIVLVVRRSAFYELVQREPHLGMVVVRNMAMDLSNKLRRTNTTFFRKPTS